MSEQTLRMLAANAPSAEAFSAVMTSGALQPDDPRYSRGRYLRNSQLAADHLGVLTRDAAATIWRRGKAGSEPAAFAATLCDDKDFLIEMLRRDRRVGVSAAVCANDHLPLETLVTYVAELSRAAGQKLSAAKSLIRRLNAEEPTVALGLLRDGLPRNVYESFAARADLTADAARSHLQARFRDDFGAAVWFNEVLSRNSVVTEWPVEDLLTLVSAPSSVAAARNLARWPALVADDTLAGGFIDAITMPDPNIDKLVPRTELATVLGGHATLSALSAEKLLAKLRELDPTRGIVAPWFALACNDAAEPTWWADEPLTRIDAAHAAGQLLARCGSLAAPQAYSSSVQLAVDWDSDVRVYVQTCLALFGDVADDPFPEPASPPADGEAGASRASVQMTLL